MTLYLTSDLHVDHYAENRTEISNFMECYLPSCDVLCVAGDTADNPKIFIDFYRLASPKYKQIFLTFGNHDLTESRPAIFKDEMQKLENVISQKPDIVMTHFIPTAFGIPRKYEDEISNAYFYFNADEYLAKMKHKSIWLAGHTHDTGRKVIQLGSKKITLLLNPIGYPMETNRLYDLNSRKLSAMLDF